jgi:hypothetical protein
VVYKGPLSDGILCSLTRNNNVPIFDLIGIRLGAINAFAAIAKEGVFHKPVQRHGQRQTPPRTVFARELEGGQENPSTPSAQSVVVINIPTLSKLLLSPLHPLYI